MNDPSATFQADQAAAAEEQASREAQTWDMHVEQHNSAVAHNYALAGKNLATGKALEAVANGVAILTAALTVRVLVDALRKALGR